MISAALILFTACSKDEKTGAFQTGKFEISQAGSPYAAIELTENGEYIVTKNAVSVKADADNADLDDVWLYGKFSYLDGRYILRPNMMFGFMASSHIWTDVISSADSVNLQSRI